MRAVVAGRFGAYTFAALDEMDFDDLLEHYAAALWLGEQESKATKPKSRK